MCSLLSLIHHGHLYFIFSVSSSQSTRSAMRTASETIVSVVNMFNKNTSLNESTITKAIQDEVVKDNNMYGYTGKY